MPDNPEVHGLREVYSALMARRVALAIAAGESRDVARLEKSMDPETGWERAAEIVELQRQMDVIEAIIVSLTMPA